MNKQLSEQTKKILAESRTIALDMGSEYISTFHLFIADCKLNGKYSIKNLIFETDEKFQTFIQLQKKTTSKIIVPELIPLTNEVKETILKAATICNSKEFYADAIYPYHLFIAASQLNSTKFYSVFKQFEGFEERLKQYYFEQIH